MKPRVATLQKLRVFERGRRVVVEHHGPASGDGPYDWSCLDLSRTEAAWLGRKLIAWAAPPPLDSPEDSE